MIASRRKAETLRERDARCAASTSAQLARLQAPAGPDAGAKTPGEIALVAIVGVLAALRGRRPDAAAAGDAVSQTPAERHAPPSEQRVGASRLVAAAAAAVDPASPATFVNPVCGIAVSIANPKHVERYDGVSYYFCCDCCWTSFREDPAKYAAIHRASLGRVSA